MQRFEPVELVFWKIENASVGKHVFLNVSMGYNLDHKTRVKTHHSMRGTGAGVTGTAPGVVSTIPEGINSSATIPPGTTSARGAGTQDQATLGFRLDLRETIQINFDPMEETEVLTIELRQQNIYNSEIISRCQIGGGQLAKMIERERGNAERNPVLNPYLQTSRTGTVSHHTTRLLFDQEQRDEVGSGQLWETLEMVPAGLLYLRCLPVRDQVGEDDV
ncbi:unnamed protein product [Amoebophrya sp. A120]|nr:unnamed protein product [Amoebophrya sp. A120]|eukprot:GSA120T00017952001.1